MFHLNPRDSFSAPITSAIFNEYVPVAGYMDRDGNDSARFRSCREM